MALALLYVAAMPMFKALAATSSVKDDVSGLYFSIIEGEALGYDGVCEVSAVPEGEAKYSGAINIPESVTINDKTYLVTKIGVDALSEYKAESNLITSVTMPNSITEIAEGALSGCLYVTTLTLSENLTEIGPYAFAAAGIWSITIPEGVKHISNNAFEDAHLFSVTLPETLETIGDSAFDGCQLFSIVIPDNVTTIGEKAFFACTFLENVSIGKSVTEIGSKAFAHSDAILYVTCYNTTPPAIEEGAFDSNIYPQADLYVYPEVQHLYEAHDVWTKFSDITTGIEKGEVMALDVAVDGDTLIIVGAADNTETIIYNLYGAVVYRGHDSRISLSSPGVYVVAVDDATLVKKVAIK
jgi:hypothetical protein